MSYTLEEVAEKSGKSQANLRKLIERGQLKADKENGRLMVSDEALDALLGADVLEDAADEVREGRFDEAGRLIVTRSPFRVLTALSGAMTDKAPPATKSQKPPTTTFGASRPAPKPSQKKK